MENQSNFENENANQASGESNATAPKTKKAGASKIVTIISAIVIIVSAVVIFTVLGDSKITMDEYNKIKTGMSYSKVVDIIGGEGKLSADGYSTEIYTWKGRGSVGANALITFQNGKVVSKAQSGLR